MKIKVLWVGKTQEEWLRRGVEEYAARIRRYAPLEIGEVKEEKGAHAEAGREAEGARLMKAVPRNARLILLDERDQIIQINPSALRMLAQEDHACRQKNIKEILPFPDIEKQAQNKELCYKNHKNEESFLMVSVTPIYKPHISTSRIMILQDITELKLRTRELERLNAIIFKASITDVLTGLYNRQELYKRIDEEIQRLERHPNTSFSVLFIDLDNLKYYNDTFGHPIGDLILKQFASVIKLCVPVIDFVCRFGGDEFVVLLTETDTQDAIQTANRILTEIKKQSYFQPLMEKELGCPISIPDNKMNSCSIGITQYDPELEVNAEELISRADRALYQAKRNNKGGFILWSPDMIRTDEITEIAGN